MFLYVTGEAPAAAAEGELDTRGGTAGQSTQSDSEEGGTDTEALLSPVGSFRSLRRRALEEGVPVTGTYHYSYSGIVASVPLD